MVISVAIIAVVFAALLPQFRNISNSWASKQGNAEVIQNGRVLMDFLNRNFAKAVKITAVSVSSNTDGYIEFEDKDGIVRRCDIAANNYIEFGAVGSLSDLAGPVSSLRFTCYGLDDLDTPITDVKSVRFIKAEVTFTNSSPNGQDKVLETETFIRTNGNSLYAGLVGGWELNETSGLIAADSSGWNYDGNLVGMVGNEWTTGIFGGALELDGSNDHVEVTVGADYSTSLTLSAWFKSDDAGSIPDNYLAQRLVTQPRDNTYSRLALGLNDNKVGAFWHDGSNNTGNGTTILSPGVWYHAALTYDSSTIRIYLDGVLENSFSESNLTAPSTNHLMQLGRQISGERRLDGCLDRVRIYDRALEPSEIVELAKTLRYREFTESKAVSDTTSLTIPTPAGTGEDDLLIAAVATDGQTSGTLLPPSGQGWSEIDLNNYSGATTLGAWWKNADVSEAATHQFTWSGAEQAYGWMMRFTGHEISNPINIYGANGQSSDTPTTRL